MIPVVQRSGRSRQGGAALFDLLAGTITALVLVTEYLGVGRQGYSALGGAQADAAGATSGVLTAVVGALVVVWSSRVRNAMSGPRATPVIVYALVLAQAMTLPAVARAGAAAGLLIASLAVAVGGLTMLAIAWRGKGAWLRGLLSVPVISGLMYAAGLMIAADQADKLARCANGTGVASFVVAGVVFGVCQGFRGLVSRLKRGASAARTAALDRLRGVSVVAGLAAGWVVYLVWRHLAPTPALCGTLGLPPGGSVTDSVKPFFAASAWTALIDPAALLLVLVGGILLGIVTLIDTLSAGAALQSTEPLQPLRADRELALNGFATLLSGVLGLLPVSLSPARTNAMRQLAATHRAPVVLHAVLLIGALLFLMPWVGNLPKAALYGSMLVVALDLVDREAVLLVRSSFGQAQPHRQIGAAWWVFVAVVVCSVLTHNALIGVALGIVISLGWLLRSPRAAQVVVSATADGWHLAFGGALLFHGTQRAMDLAATEFLDELAAGAVVHIDLAAVRRMDWSALRCIDGFCARLRARGAVVELTTATTPASVAALVAATAHLR